MSSRRTGSARIAVVPAAVAALLGCGNVKSAAPDAGMQPATADVDDDFPLPLAAGLAPTPPMGWNSWNAFGCNVNANLIEAVADSMVGSGMRDAGYQYVNMDDCWALPDRAVDGSVVPNPAAFPDGIQPVADYVHGKGLKLGIYADRGTETCDGKAGSQGHETQDAQSYAAWGVDYLKYDNCNATLDIQTQYTAMGDALRATGRDFVYSLCAWQFYEWGVGLGQLWRTTTDIKPSWASVYANLLANQALAAYAGPNGWNDPDMLEVGNDGLGNDEARAHFTMWALSAAPLIAGNDLRHMTDATAAILTNAEVIALDQDALGLQGALVRNDSDLSVWAKPLNENGARAVVLLNGTGAPADVTFGLAEVGLRAGGTATARDLWAHADLPPFVDTMTASVPSHGVVALRVKGDEPARPSGTVALSDLTWTYASNGLGPIERDMSVGATAPGDGAPISLRGQTYARGLGMGAPAAAIFRLAQSCTTFTADVGVDDVTSGAGSVVFQVFADGDKLYDSGVVTGTSPVQSVSVDVTGRRRLKLVVTNGGDGAADDSASWGNPQLVCPGTP
jgi:alpha-galactosidase